MALLRKMGVLLKPTTYPSLYLYLSLRLLQFGAALVTLTYFCSLVGWHNSHYCSQTWFKNRCNPSQQDLARVPKLYVIFITMCCFMILAAFGLSYRQLSSFLSYATGAKGSIGLSDGGTDDSNQNGLMVHDAFPIFRLCRRAFRSVPKSALLIDSAVLIVLSLCLNEYWTSIIRPYHMHTNYGFAYPVCWLFVSGGPMNTDYWKNLKVEYQRCMDNQLSFYCTIGVMVFTLMLVVVDAFYLRYEWSTKKALEDVLVEDSEKSLLVDVTA